MDAAPACPPSLGAIAPGFGAFASSDGATASRFGATASRRSRRQRGFTLTELLIVLAILATAVGGATLSFRALARTTARTDAGRLAASIRYLYDRAVTTGAYYRLVLDLTANEYWAEKSDERFYLVRDKESSRSGKAPDEEEKEKRLKEEEDREQEALTGLAKELLPPPKPRRARFEAFKDSSLPHVKLKISKLRDVLTPRQTEPYVEGRAYLYFFPDGHTERALIHLTDDDEHVVSLLVQPLTGRVEVKPGDVEPERDFERDDEGQKGTPR